MKALKNCSISELVATLETRGVIWEGLVTRKAPLIELIERLEALPTVRSESDLPSTMRSVSAPVDTYTWEQLVLIWQHFKRGPLKSEEILNQDTMWAKVKALLCSLPGRLPAPLRQLPSRDRVLSYNWEHLKQLNHFQLMIILEILGYGTYRGDNQELLGVVKSTIANMRHRADRNLEVDVENCNYILESKTGFQFKIDFWNTPLKPHHHALVIQDLKERGFYEADFVTGGLHGLYLMCDLEDNPQYRKR